MEINYRKNTDGEVNTHSPMGVTENKTGRAMK